MSMGTARMAVYFVEILKVSMKVFVRPLHIIGSTICDNLAIKYAISNRAKAVTTRVIWNCELSFETGHIISKYT